VRVQDIESITENNGPLKRDSMTPSLNTQAAEPRRSATTLLPWLTTNHGAFMEPRGCNRWQLTANRIGAEAEKQAKTVAVGRDRLPLRAHGKGRVDSTSLLLKRGSPSSLRKSVESHKTRSPAGFDSDCNASGATVDDPSTRSLWPPCCLW
jgi:hypothetical protein